MLTRVKVGVRHSFPRLWDNLLLMFPFLYRTRIVKYETDLGGSGIDELLAQLEKVSELDGNVIECGAAYCGSSVIMAEYLRLRHVDKLIYACDSFEGFNERELAKERERGLTMAGDKAFTYTSYEYVKRKIKRLGFDGAVVLVKGFFEETLETIESKFCFALVDCDLEASTLYSMERVWRDLVGGGRILVDDYHDEGWGGVKRAVDFFVGKHRDEIAEYGSLNRLYLVCKE